MWITLQTMGWDGRCSVDILTDVNNSGIIILDSQRVYASQGTDLRGLTQWNIAHIPISNTCAVGHTHSNPALSGHAHVKCDLNLRISLPATPLVWYILFIFSPAGFLRWRSISSCFVELNTMRTSTFTIISAVAASITAIKHDGKAHHHVRPRQDESTSTSTPAAATATAYSANISAAGVLTNSSMSTSTSMTNTAATSSYDFPTTVIQVPVATVCPDTPSSSAAFSILPVPSSLSSSSNSSTNLTATNNSVRVNATALLPNGSTTVFLSTTTRPTAVGGMVSNTSTSATQLPTGDTEQGTDAGTATARIILDSNGCQTVYSAKTTALCTTTLHPAGMLPVHVTECDQWVTFSSEKLDGCSATTSATAATDANTLTASTPTSSDTAPPDPSITGPTAFYVAHWYDLAHSPNVPSVVRVEDCLPLTTGLSCLTSSESWSVVRSTSTRTGTSLAAFSGVSSTFLSQLLPSLFVGNCFPDSRTYANTFCV